MVRGIVKTPKKASDADAFQSSMARAGKFFKDNAFTIILSVAVIAAFVVYYVAKSGPSSKDTSGWGVVETETDPRELLKKADESKGKPVEKMLRLRAANLYYAQYQREEAPYIGGTPSLDTAENIYRELLAKYEGDEENDGFLFPVRESLEIIARERADREAGKFPLIEKPVQMPEPVEEEFSPPESPEGAGQPESPKESELPKESEAPGEPESPKESEAPKEPDTPEQPKSP
jgi:hypothetical protein